MQSQQYFVANSGKQGTSSSGGSRPTDLSINAQQLGPTITPLQPQYQLTPNQSTKLLKEMSPKAGQKISKTPQNRMMIMNPPMMSPNQTGNQVQNPNNIATQSPSLSASQYNATAQAQNLRSKKSSNTPRSRVDSKTSVVKGGNGHGSPKNNHPSEATGVQQKAAYLDKMQNSNNVNVTTSSVSSSSRGQISSLASGQSKTGAVNLQQSSSTMIVNKKQSSTSTKMNGSEMSLSSGGNGGQPNFVASGGQNTIQQNQQLSGQQQQLDRTPTVSGKGNSSMMNKYQLQSTAQKYAPSQSQSQAQQIYQQRPNSSAVGGSSSGGIGSTASTSSAMAIVGVRSPKAVAQASAQGSGAQNSSTFQTQQNMTSNVMGSSESSKVIGSKKPSVSNPTGAPKLHTQYSPYQTKISTPSAASMLTKKLSPNQSQLSGTQSKPNLIPQSNLTATSNSNQVQIPKRGTLQQVSSTPTFSSHLKKANQSLTTNQHLNSSKNSNNFQDQTLSQQQLGQQNKLQQVVVRAGTTANDYQPKSRQNTILQQQQASQTSINTTGNNQTNFMQRRISFENSKQLSPQIKKQALIFREMLNKKLSKSPPANISQNQQQQQNQQQSVVAGCQTQAQGSGNNQGTGASGGGGIMFKPVQKVKPDVAANSQSPLNANNQSQSPKNERNKSRNFRMSPQSSTQQQKMIQTQMVKRTNPISSPNIVAAEAQASPKTSHQGLKQHLNLSGANNVSNTSAGSGQASQKVNLLKSTSNPQLRQQLQRKVSNQLFKQSSPQPGQRYSQQPSSNQFTQPQASRSPISRQTTAARQKTSQWDEQAVKRHQNELLRQIWLSTEQNEELECMQLLESVPSELSCALLNQCNSDQWTPLHVASNEGHANLIELFVGFGATVDARTRNFRTPLHIASIRGNLGVIQTLLMAGADINAKDIDGNTPCHFCSEFGHKDCLRYLLLKHPSLICKNKENFSPLDVAVNTEILEIFQEYITQVKNILSSQTPGTQNTTNIKPQPQNKHTPPPLHLPVTPNTQQMQQQVIQSSGRSTNTTTNPSNTKIPILKAGNELGAGAAVTVSKPTIQQTKIKSTSSTTPKAIPGQKITTQPKSIPTNVSYGVSKGVQQSVQDDRKKQTTPRQSQKQTYTPLETANDQPDNTGNISGSSSQRRQLQTDEATLRARAKNKHVQIHDSIAYQPGNENVQEQDEESIANANISQDNGINQSAHPQDYNSRKDIPNAQNPVQKVGSEDYTPLSLLGRGSFGEVYLVRAKNSKELFAMKVLSKEKILGQNLVRYAKTERNVLSYTTHNFIVGLNAAFQTKTKLFLILDFCPGGDLGRLIQREGRFTEQRAMFYLAEILLALDDLHKRDIIFRDLKPDNVVIDNDGHALLTDFGLSKEGVNEVNYGARSFCGSVAYLAPEMIRKAGHGKSVDWYLLGVLLYEMLVGQPPYFSKSKTELFNNIQRGPLKLPTNMSSEAKNLIVTLLNRNPSNRLGSGEHGADEIKNHPFFAALDWEQCKTRKLAVPGPRHTLQQYKEKFKDVVCTEEQQRMVYEDQTMLDSQNANQVEGWSFVNPGNITDR